MLRSAAPPLHVTPATEDRNVAADWFRRFEGAGLDGVMAKPAAGLYESDKRVMFKVKHERDCDCVVAGFRWYKKGEKTAVGSLLLGLFDDDGALQHVGVCASFTQEMRRDLVNYLAPYRENALADHPWQNWAQ
jgi:ATP-dependent DNA ligase